MAELSDHIIKGVSSDMRLQDSRNVTCLSPLIGFLGEISLVAYCLVDEERVRREARSALLPWLTRYHVIALGEFQYRPGCLAAGGQA
jgi:hypothetical protein